MKTITFYSFKGGTGRTTIAANVSVQLASRGFNTSIIDFDIFSSGLANFYPNFVPNSYLQQIISEALRNYLRLKNEERLINYEETIVNLDFRRTIHNYRDINNIFRTFNFIGNGNINIIPSTNKILEEEYNIINNIIYRRNLDIFQDFSIIQILFPIISRYKEILRDEMKSDYLLIDSPSGLSDLAQIPISESQYMVVVTTIDNQSFYGTLYFLRYILEHYNRGLSSIFVLFNMVPQAINDNYIRDRYDLIEIIRNNYRFINFNYGIIRESQILRGGERIFTNENEREIFKDLTDSIIEFFRIE
jgi:MinD-like ATPase involved in chromosome partitioning or flagellar assembly